MYALIGEDFAYPVRFLVEGDFVVPDADTVKMTIRGQTGTVVSGWNQKAVDHEGKSAITVVIDGAVNAVTGGQREKRTVIVNFRYNDLPYSIQGHYFLTEYLNVTACPADVRKVFGTEFAELPDSMISIEDAYYDIIRIYGDKSVFDNALIDTDKMQMANQLIVAAAANRLVQTLMIRVNQSEMSDQESFKRFDKVDWDAYRITIADMGAEAADTVFDRSASTGGATFLDKVTPTDVITGA